MYNASRCRNPIRKMCIDQKRESGGIDTNFNTRDPDRGKFHLSKSGKNDNPFYGIIDLLNVYLNHHPRRVLKVMFNGVGYFQSNKDIVY